MSDPQLKTVGQWFDYFNGPNIGKLADGLSQFNGPAVWLRFDRWEAMIFGKCLLCTMQHFDGTVKVYGMGTLMHEIMHKQAVAGGFTHNDKDPPDKNDFLTIMRSVLSDSALGIPASGLNDVSQALGSVCFAGQ
jgi:hypothetical protein